MFFFFCNLQAVTLLHLTHLTLLFYLVMIINFKFSCVITLYHYYYHLLSFTFILFSIHMYMLIVLLNFINFLFIFISYLSVVCTFKSILYIFFSICYGFSLTNHLILLISESQNYSKDLIIYILFILNHITFLFFLIIENIAILSTLFTI